MCRSSPLLADIKCNLISFAMYFKLFGVVINGCCLKVVLSESFCFSIKLTCGFMREFQLQMLCRRFPEVKIDM